MIISAKSCSFCVAHRLSHNKVQANGLQKHFSPWESVSFPGRAPFVLAALPDHPAKLDLGTERLNRCPSLIAFQDATQPYVQWMIFLTPALPQSMTPLPHKTVSVASWACAYATPSMYVRFENCRSRIAANCTSSLASGCSSESQSILLCLTQHHSRRMATSSQIGWTHLPLQLVLALCK